jgi:hypothetical protein
MSFPAASSVPGRTACVFCGTTNGKLTCEHVIPKWARRSFGIKGPVTVDARKEGLDKHRRVGSMQAPNITLDDAICEDYNSVAGWGRRIHFLSPDRGSRRQAARLTMILVRNDDTERESPLAFRCAMCCLRQR